MNYEQSQHNNKDNCERKATAISHQGMRDRTSYIDRTGLTDDRWSKPEVSFWTHFGQLFRPMKRSREITSLAQRLQLQKPKLTSLKRSGIDTKGGNHDDVCCCLEDDDEAAVVIRRTRTVRKRISIESTTATSQERTTRNY